MINTSDEKGRARSAKAAGSRTKTRAEQAQIVTGLQSVLEADEQLFAFTRGVIAGGLRGKLTVGFEALFAPYVNIGLTERRIVLQHVQPESGKPNEILPHSFPLAELRAVAFSDIETFGGEPEGRLNLRLFNDQHFRLRCKGSENVASAQTIGSVFDSLTSARPKARTSPTQSLCPHCDRVLDTVTRFCPYCGHGLDGAPESPGNGGAAEMLLLPGEGAHEPDAASDGPAPEWGRDDNGAEEVDIIAEAAPNEIATEGHEAAAPVRAKKAAPKGDTPE